MWGVCGGQSGAGAGFPRVIRFPVPNFIQLIAPQSPSSIIWGWYSKPVVAAVPSGLSLTPLRIIMQTNTSHNLGFTIFFLICIVGVESKLGPLGTSATHWPIVPAPARKVFLLQLSFPRCLVLDVLWHLQPNRFIKVTSFWPECGSVQITISCIK
jgi:hypothetical protein